VAHRIHAFNYLLDDGRALGKDRIYENKQEVG